MSNPIRLNKVLKELNISLDRAVDFLASKNISIEPRPTSKIDQDTYNLMLDEFQTDKSDKDILEKINIQKRKEFEEQLAAENKIQESNETKEVQPVEEKPEEVQPVEEKPEEVQPLEEKPIENQPEMDSSIKINEDSTKIETNFQKLSGIKKTGEVIDLE